MVDKTRASREGHHFHETWAARRALELLAPRDNLIGIAVEGLSPTDQADAPEAASEIADLTLYYGDDCSFKNCERQEILQLKYSIASAESDFVASDASKTLKKFVLTERDAIVKYGEADVIAKLSYEIVTNRPIGAAFAAAVNAIASKADVIAPNIQSQVDQICKAIDLSGDMLACFAGRLKLTGSAGGLHELKSQTRHRLADWSAARDLLAKSRLAGLQDLVRDKAEGRGEGRNVIKLVDVLSALGIAHEDDLLPTPDSFPEIGEVVPRSQSKIILDRLHDLDRPLIIHAVGGVGKTVLLQSIAAAAEPCDEVVLFDCFGGGAYRALEDARHLAKRGLLHIVNLLATRGLCDPLLPDADDVAELLRRTRSRLEQAVATLHIANPSARVLILIDAADNAAQQAQDRGEQPFPRQLLESVSLLGLPDGVRLIASCRTERQLLAYGNAEVELFPLEAFTVKEITTYVESRVADTTASEIAVAHARSGGNPRVLSHLVENWIELVRRPGTQETITVDELIQQRINRAISEVEQQGYGRDRILAFLAGLTVLPPPIPVSEYACAHGIAEAEVASFAVDLAPLLDRTSLGLIFRDEPTETLVRGKYGADKELLKLLAQRLDSFQENSLYAARALPGLLQLLGDTEKALELALSDRMPDVVKSEVGKRGLRIARIRAAIVLAAKTNDLDSLVRLLVELGSLTAAHSRGDAYIGDNPDLVIIANDTEALRRLFEIKANWPGARHARLGIAQLLAGDESEAARHVRRASEWFQWLRSQPNDENKPNWEAGEIVVLPLYQLACGNLNDVAYEIGRWRPWFGYDISRRLLSLASMLPRVSQHPFVRANGVAALRRCRAKVPALFAAAIVSGPDLDSADEIVLLKKLARSLRKNEGEDDSSSHGDQRHPYRDALIAATGRAVSQGLPAEAQAILASFKIRRPNLYAFEENWLGHDLPSWLLYAIVSKLAHGNAPDLIDILPDDLAELLEGVQYETTEKTVLIIRDILKSEERKPSSDKKASRSVGRSADNAIDLLQRRIVPLLPLVQECARLISKQDQVESVEAIGLIDLWKALRVHKSGYRDSGAFIPIFDNVGRELVFWTLRVTRAFNGMIADAIVASLRSSDLPSSETVIEQLAVFAGDSETHEAAAVLAGDVDKQIRQEHDVERRGALFAALARAIYPAASAESGAFFRQGLSDLEAIGSGDYKLIQELLLLASKTKGAHLSIERAQRLYNLCELNFLDEPKKFPWVDFSQASAAATGVRVLAQLGRWDDADLVDLSYPLSTVISALLEKRLLEPESALALLMLEAPAYWWHWSLGALAKALLGHGAKEPERLAGILVQQIEWSDPRSPSPRTLDDIAEAFRLYLPDGSPVIQRLNDLQPLAKKMRDIQNERSNSRSFMQPDPVFETEREKDKQEALATFEAIVESTDPTNADSIDLALTLLEGLKQWGRDSTLLARIRSKVSYAQRVAHIEALISTRELSPGTKIETLKECIDAWVETSPAVRELRTSIAERVITTDFSALSLQDYGLDRDLLSLSELGPVPISRLAVTLVGVLSAHDLEIEAHTWLYLAAVIAEKASPNALGAALNRLLDSDAARLADGVRLGFHTPTLDPGNSAEEVVAGLIWLRLGNPDAVLRWRAAHAVRLLGQLERWAEIDCLISREAWTDAGAFGDGSVKFHYLNARLWLLIGLAAAARDNPGGIARYKGLFERLCGASEHNVVIRQIAADGLTTLIENDQSASADALRAEMLIINVSPYPALSYPAANYDPWHSSERPDNASKELTFHFDYDFQKHQLPNLARIFGLETWKIKDRVAAKVLSWAPDIKGMSDGGGRRNYHGRYDSRSIDGRQQSYGQQLTWHAIATVAGELLAERPVREDSNGWGDPWAAFLREKLLTRRDGRWLSEGTDSYPLGVRVHLLEDAGAEHQIPSDALWLASFSTLAKDGRVGKDLVVSSSWTSVDDTHVRIQSALLPERGALKVCQKFAKREPLDQWLPSLRQEGEEDHPHYNRLDPFEAWIVDRETTLGLDEYDSFGSRTADERLRLDRKLLAEFDLKSDPFGREWSNPNGVVMHAEAWGSRSGQGEYETIDSGEQLRGQSDFILDILEQKKSALAILVTALRTIKRSNSDYQRESVGALLLLLRNGTLTILPTVGETPDPE